MNKNVLTVIVVILTPIIILGILAVAGAENFEKAKEAAGDEHSGENTTETAAMLVPIQTIKLINAQTNDLFGSIWMRALV